MKKKISIAIITLIVIVTCVLIVNAGGGDSKKVTKVKIDGKQYLQFQVLATGSTATYRYRTKGWYVKAKFGEKDFDGFFTDSQLEQRDTDSIVELPLKEILKSIGVTDEYLSQGGRLRLDAGQIIVVNGVETEPKYDSWEGIVNGIKDRYGIEWTSGTKSDLESYYKLFLDFDPVLKPDKITINYLEKGTNKELLPSKTETMTVGKNTYDIPAFTTLTFDEWVFDGGSPSKVDPVEVSSEGNDKHYILNIYYTADTPSEIKAVIDAPDEVDKNKSFELDGTKSYTSDGTWITEYHWESRLVSESSFHHSSYGDKFPHVGISENTEFKLTVTNNRGDTDSTTKIVKIKGKDPDPPEESGDADLRFEISEEIEKRGGIINNGVYDSNFDIKYEYIEGYEDDPPYYGIETWELEIIIEGDEFGPYNYYERDMDDNPQKALGDEIDDKITSWARGKPEGEYDCDVYLAIHGKGEKASWQDSGTIKVTSSGGTDPDPDPTDDYMVKINAYDENGNKLSHDISPNPIEFDADGDKTVPVVTLDNYTLKKVILSNLGAGGNVTKEITDLTVLVDGNFNFTVSYDGDTTFTLVKAESLDVNLELESDRLTVEYHFERDKSAPSALSLYTSKEEAQINETVSYTVRQDNLEELKVYRREDLFSQKGQLMTGTTFTSQYPKRIYIVGVGKGNFVDKTLYLDYAVKASDENVLNTASPLDILTINDLESMAYYDLQPFMNMSKDEMNISIDPSTVEWNKDIKQKWSWIDGPNGKNIDDKHIYSYRKIKLKVNSSYWYAYDSTKFFDDRGVMYSKVELDAEPDKQKTGDMVTLIPTLLNTHSEKYSHGNNSSSIYKVPLADQEIHGLEFTSDDEGEQVAAVVAKGNFVKSRDWTVYANSVSTLTNQAPEKIRSLSSIQSELESYWERKLGNSDFTITLLTETYVWDTDINVGDFDNDNPVYYKYSRDIDIHYTIDTNYDYEIVEFVDDLELGKIIIECRDSATDGLIKTVNMNGQELNKNISVDSPTVSGYDFDPSRTSSPQTVKLTDGEKEKTVIFYYIKGAPGPIGGSGEIVFNPNTSDDILGNREGWVNKDISVNVSISGDKTAERSDTAPRAYQYEEEKQVEDGTDKDGNPKYKTVKETKNDIASCTFTETWEVGTISVTGSASGTVSGMDGGNVTISTEGDTLQLSATLNEWVSKEKVWGSDSAPNGGSWTDNGTPSGNTTPPDLYIGTSGIYKLDKTNPNSSSDIPSRDWTNVAYNVLVTATDNLSGFWNSTSYYNITDRSHYGRNQGNQYFTKTSINETKTININQNGVYSIHVGLEDIAKNIMTGRTYGEFKFDNIPPYVAKFDIVGCNDVAWRNIPDIGNGYQYMTDYDNKIRVTIGDELSGLIDTKFLITKESTFPNESSMKNLNEGTGEAITAPINKTFYINLNCGATKESVAASKFADLKEGLWYVHIYQRDRAGNVTKTISPPIFINKIRDLRITGVADYNWKKYFLDENNNPTNLAKTGIPIRDMPVYKTKEENAIKLGYKVYFKMDTIGFDEGNDTIKVKPRFWAIDENNKIKEVRLYVEDDNSGDYKLIENSGYNPLAYDITLNSSHRNKRDGTTDKEKNHIWQFDYYLPPWTKAVPIGQELDLVKENYEKQKLLIVFEITGNKTYNSKFFYTAMDDTWGRINENISFNGVEKETTDYGRKRSTYLDLLYLNDKDKKNHGEVLWYNLYESAIDDLKFYREW